MRPDPASSAEPSTLERGRDALRRHAWGEAWELLTQADREMELSGADLERLADAAFFAAHPDQVVDTLERAFAAHLGAGDPLRAAYVALDLARQHGERGRSSIAGGWLRRAERLLEDQPESYAHGYLALMQAEMARLAGDGERALALVQEAIAIGNRTRDAELRAWGLRDLGTLRVAAGAPHEGLALLEEASVAAVSGELSPFATGVICCTMISVCRDLTDYRRAAEWIEATDRYCERQSVSGFPGACRVHRAEIGAVRGAWDRAETELQLATAELARFGAAPLIADGYYALGEVRRLRGDLEGAEEALREAHALGRSPHPALALVRLAQGRPDAAATAIRAALDEETFDRWARVRLLPAQVEIELAMGERRRARAALDELEAAISGFTSPTLEATAASVRGRVLLAEGDAPVAVRELRAAIRGWRDVGNPYEGARSRLVLADALARLGDDEDADLELGAARDELARLGAAIELRAAERALAAAEERRRGPRQERKTLMFTDIVGSTRLAEALGDRAWAGLLAWHDRTLRELIEGAGGQVVNGTGDGFFAAFDKPGAAVGAARAIQRALADQRQATGFALGVRIGLHATEATRRGGDYGGLGVHIAARVAALAGEGEILATEGTLREAGLAPGGDRHEVEVKGVAEPIVVAAVPRG